MILTNLHYNIQNLLSRLLKPQEVSKSFRNIICLMLLIIISFSLFYQPDVSEAQTTFPILSIRIGVDEAKEPGDVAIALEIIVLLTILTLAPVMLILMTSFTRIISDCNSKYVK